MLETTRRVLALIPSSFGSATYADPCRTLDLNVLAGNQDSCALCGINSLLFTISLRINKHFHKHVWFIETIFP